MDVVRNESGLYQVSVDEHVYEFEKWGAEDATDTILDIAAIMGKPIGLGMAALFSKDEDGNSGLEKDFNPDLIGSVMDALTSQVTANKMTIKALIKKLSSVKVLCDGKKIDFNLHYKDRLAHLFKVVRAALEVQYGNFFDALFANIPEKAKTAVGIRNLA